MLLVYIMLEFRNEYLWKRLEFMCKRIKLPSQKCIWDFTSAYFPSMAFLEQTFLSVCEFNAPVNVLYWFLWFLFIYIAVLWLSRVNVEASTALNHSTKLTSVEKVSSQEGNKNVNDKYKKQKKNHAIRCRPDWDSWYLKKRQAASCYVSMQEALHGNRPNLIWEH